MEFLYALLLASVTSLLNAPTMTGLSLSLNQSGIASSDAMSSRNFVFVTPSYNASAHQFASSTAYMADVEAIVGLSYVSLSSIFVGIIAVEVNLDSLTVQHIALLYCNPLS